MSLNVHYCLGFNDLCTHVVNVKKRKIGIVGDQVKYVHKQNNIKMFKTSELYIELSGVQLWKVLLHQ